jgi:hypothetical protein
MSFQVRYFRDGLQATSYTACAETMLEARHLAKAPKMKFGFDFAVIETLDQNNNYQTIDILLRDPEHRATNR